MFLCYANTPKTLHSRPFIAFESPLVQLQQSLASGMQYRQDMIGFLYNAHNAAARLHCCHKGPESHAYLAEVLQDPAAVALVCQSHQASTHSSTVVASKQSKPILTCGYDTRNMVGSNSHAPVC